MTGNRTILAGVLLAVSCLVMLFPFPAQAGAEAKPFVRGSYPQIVATRQGKPFIVNFWSLTCSYCVIEMEMFRKLKKKYPSLDLVLVSTDTPEEEGEVSAILAKHALDKAESWIFADSYVERLRFEVDRKWQGELPRTYFYDRKGNVAAVSGKLEYKEVEQWVKEQYTAR